MSGRAKSKTSNFPETRDRLKPPPKFQDTFAAVLTFPVWRETQRFGPGQNLGNRAIIANLFPFGASQVCSNPLSQYAVQPLQGLKILELFTFYVVTVFVSYAAIFDVTNMGMQR